MYPTTIFYIRRGLGLENCQELVDRIGMPEGMQHKMNAYKRAEDRERFLLGKYLLIIGLCHLGYQSGGLQELCFSNYSKPFLENGPHFNISHSEDYVICVFNEKKRVGIDVEKIKPVDIKEFGFVLSAGEREMIHGSGDPLNTFYRIWTRKEALIKGDGRGIFFPLQAIDVTENLIVLDRTKWLLQEIELAGGYIAHLATEDFSEELIINQIKI